MDEAKAEGPVNADHGEEIHIAGLLIYVAPASTEAVAAFITQDRDAEVHARSQSKLVVVVEKTDAQQVMAFVDALRETTGVLNVTLVYQHTESAQDMEDVLDDHHT